MWGGHWILTSYKWDNLGRDLFLWWPDQSLVGLGASVIEQIQGDFGLPSILSDRAKCFKKD